MSYYGSIFKIEKDESCLSHCSLGLSQSFESLKKYGEKCGARLEVFVKVGTKFRETYYGYLI